MNSDEDEHEFGCSENDCAFGYYDDEQNNRIDLDSMNFREDEEDDEENNRIDLEFMNFHDENDAKDNISTAPIPMTRVRFKFHNGIPPERRTISSSRIDLKKDYGEWKCKQIPVYPKPFITQSGITHKLHSDPKSPLFFWKKLISEPMLEYIVFCTNEYAKAWFEASEDEIYDGISNAGPNLFRKKPTWLTSRWKTSIHEIKRMIAVMYLMAFIKLPNLRSYWKCTYKYFALENIHRIMSRNRFFQLKSCIHFVHHLHEKDLEDPLWKIRIFLDWFLKNCQINYRCGEYVSLDEMMIRFSGKQHPEEDVQEMKLKNPKI